MYVGRTNKTRKPESQFKKQTFPCSLTVTHFDFGAAEVGAAVQAMQSDGVELALVQVDQGQLVGLVRGSQWGSQGKLELCPESLQWGVRVRAGVDRAGLLLWKGVAVVKSLRCTKRHEGIC